MRSGSTGKRAWLLLALVAAPLAAHAGVAWIGRLIAVGRPEVTVLVGFAPALALLALCADLLASRLRAVDPRSASSRAAGALRGAAELYGVLGATYSILALLAVHDFTLREALLLAAAPLLLCAAAARRAIREGSAAAAFGSELFLLLLWLCLRIAGPLGGDLGPLGSDADALAGVLLGLAFLGLRALVARGAASSDAQQAFQRPALVAAHLFPLLGLVGVLTGSAAHPSAALGLAAVHFAALAAQSRGKLAAVVGALCLDAALFVAFHSHGFSDPQLYGIPAGLTLVLLARLFATDLGPEQAARLRALGAVVLYAASSYRALIFADPIYPLVTAGLCVLGVALGISLRIRAWLYVGTTFLVVDVAGNAIRHGLADHRIGALALTLLGLLVVGFMIFFTARREELLQRVRAYQLLIRSWS